MYSQPTRSERQQFQEEHGSLTSLLLSWTVAYERTDEEVLAEVIREDPPEALWPALEEGKKLLQQKQLPWKIITDIANYSFPTELAVREWLIWLMNRLEASLSAKYAPLTPAVKAASSSSSSQ